MPELGFQDHRSGFRPRDVSPDSVIFTADSSFSLFSSASGSAERCSFASDDSCFHNPPQSHLTAHEIREASCDPAPDPNKPVVSKNNHFGKKGKVKVQKADSKEADTEDEYLAFGSSRRSFSQALKECQESRYRSEAVLNKSDRQSLASLDLKNSVINATISSSPRFGVMKKESITGHSGAFPSPGTPNYRHSSAGIQKGWTSERVSSHTSANRSKCNTLLLPFNNGRNLPSKWEDAERWIFSPVSGDGATKTSLQQPQKQRKSKSGPLGPPGAAYYSLYSPAVPVSRGKSIANSPFSTRVMKTDGLSIHDGGHDANGNYVACSEPCMARSISIHGCSELLSLSSMIAPQDDESRSDKDAAANVSRVVSRRDMATQMSPEASPHSSPRRRSSFSSSTPSIVPFVEVQSFHPSRAEVKDVAVDERVTMTRWSKKHRARIPGSSLENIDNWKTQATEMHSAGREISETKSASKIKREEARITAWENLQKAKAEAAIRKLEMKLEKKRSSSMTKIMNKLRTSQKKAEEMRSSMVTTQGHEVTRASSRKALSFRPTRRMGSLSGCFTCPAF
ncbi:PREDICTED: uncharacterized protein LOC109170013 [Ipomoea nil]|uniref:uncharacterized protein LOC109170013 n=1 Tax=Ipomoea nil TaxID=35883 RepID=UPI000901B680|nr:PREDICTED: uncharacterized protein LOC109170013 [Ipomoea nil]XP_019174476.1 PREDICTED: uncharacterized protein LOC109170013 [Ipomoea nil]